MNRSKNDCHLPSIYTHLSIQPSPIHRYIHPHIHRSSHRYINPSIHPIDPSIDKLIHPSIHRYIDPSINTLIHLSIHRYIDSLIDTSIDPSIDTLIDTSINLFLLELEGFTPEQIKYLGRHKRRVEIGLTELNRRFDPQQGVVRDSELRCSCFLDWALFRNRINLDGLDNLKGLLEAANKVPEFAATPLPR